MISIFCFTLLHLANSFVSLFGGARIPPGRIKNLQETAQKFQEILSVAMTKRHQHCYEFGGFVLDVDNHVLWRGADPVPLQPKAFETLLLLVERR
ncbi:MAG TPA: hypothetical protein VHS05_16705, partial [Pyrinomonadaceae bacterium]|nr:hypothetical protein [Pyrinomonadaceae bacterium]